ncbi:Tripartite-type tricarboxylate transporter, receptor component TctC [Blastococcus sp. DSM 46786]|nr:Tripartite-type tricarboxylate transporter, receptor component TctC [Blastococcus sp. DSM 46786]
MRTRTTSRRAAGRHAAVAVALAGALTACGSGGDAEDGAAAAEGAFEGEDLDLVVPYEPGGGYDAYARALAPYLEECTGARVVVRNEPGAGGLVATNKTAAAPASENRLQIVNTVGLVSAQIAGAEGANFDLDDLNWIGRVSAPPNVVVVSPDSRFQTWQDIVDAEETVRFVAQGPGANDYIAPTILGEAYGFPYEIVTGFAGSTEARQAVVAGNADAHALPVDSQLGAIESGDVRPVVTVDDEPDPLLPDTPAISDTEAADADAQTIVDNLIAMGQTGRSLIASPQMEEDRVAALREGYQCAIGNQELVDELESQQRPLNPLSGEETAQLVREVLDSPEEFQQLVVDSY